ncbi:MAG TPA: hypothetical protein VFX28_06490, partial [Methylomirabilota bacterium]|nr:hypothetical protein [Methylomirabilota bacterium]
MSVESRRSTVAEVSLFAAHDAPVGSVPASFEARVFEQLQLHRVPLQLTVLPGRVEVRALPASLTATQGDTLAFDVHVISEGGPKHVTLSPGLLPKGVRMEPASFFVGPGSATHVQRMRLVVDADAPTTSRAWTPIHWSAGDGAHASVLDVPLTINLRPDSRTFRQEITTPPGTALGGFAELVVHNDGRFTFRGHMHGSGFDPYAFRVNVFLRTPTLTLADVFSSRVGGTLGGGPRDRDWSRDGRNDLLRLHWPEISRASAEFSKWYENRGVLGTLEDFALAVAEFLVVRALAGPAVAAILVVGSELAQMADLPVTTPRSIPGAVVLGGVVFLFGPLAALPAVVAGVAVAAIGDVKSRPMHESEKADARRVFGDTLPFDRIRVTNLIKRG